MYDPLKAKAKVALSTTFSFLLGLALASQFGFTGSPEVRGVDASPRVADAAVQPALDLSEAFVSLADEMVPSVVRIEVPRRQERRTSPLEQFFGAPQQRDLPDISVGGGSGFVVSSDGYVLTNNHVVKDAESITVALPDGRSFAADLVGGDPTTDVAVVKIEGGDLPVASLGLAADVRVGEWVLAIGNPGFTGRQNALDYSVTAGIVSALGRPLGLIQSDLSRDPDAQGNLALFAIEDFIQTDAVINPGNSGGPMVNLRGQVIGINSAIYTRTGYYQGYGFAIPIDLAHRVMEDLVAYGHVRRAWLGVQIAPIRPEDAEWYGLPEVAGALVQRVTPATPAAAAGLRQHDVITALDGESVRSSNDLQRKIALRAPGDRLALEIYRDKRRMDVEVHLEQAPFSRREDDAPAPRARPVEKIGIEVTSVTTAIARELGLESTDGVVVEDVQTGGPAFRRGLGRGCVITDVNRRRIQDMDDLDAVFRDAKADDVLSLIASCPDARGGRTGDLVYNVRVPR